MQNEINMEALNAITDKVLGYKPPIPKQTKRIVKQRHAQVLPDSTIL